MQRIRQLAAQLRNPIPLGHVKSQGVHRVLQGLQFSGTWQGQKNRKILATRTVVSAQPLAQGLDQGRLDSRIGLTIGASQQHLSCQALTGIPATEGVIVMGQQMQ